jgi:hypothetical protein
MCVAVCVSRRSEKIHIDKVSTLGGYMNIFVNGRQRNVLCLGVTLVAVLIMGQGLPAQQAAERSEPLGNSSRFEQVRNEVFAWLDSQPLDEPVRRQLREAWLADVGRGDESQLLDRVAVTVAAVVPEANQVYQACQQKPTLPLPAWPLFDPARPEDFVSRTMRVYVARWLVHHQLYDEAIELTRGLKPEDVVFPATLLFYQSVAHHKLLHKDECLPLLARLLANESSIPRRYRDVARLMTADLTPLQPDSLDEISRMMDDIRRRLDLGRAGRIVRKQEDDVIAKLDKMIEELEKQLQQQQAAAAGGGNLQPSQPAQDSVPLGGTGPGNVAQRNIGHGSGWGNLPPRQREEALQEISKNLPSHYRSVIEEYFRKLARTSD